MIHLSKQYIYMCIYHTMCIYIYIERERDMLPGASSRARARLDTRSCRPIVGFRAQQCCEAWRKLGISGSGVASTFRARTF